jgi:type VI secretion system ImpA family protein
MSGELVISNFDEVIKEILIPVSTEKPSGENLKYEGTYNLIVDAMRYENPDLAQGLWVRPLKKADWKTAVNICVQSLKTRTKDLQIAAWLTQALLRQSGFEGLKYGLKLILLLSQTFWENVYPEGDDVDVRISPFVWMDEKLCTQLKFIPITEPLPEHEPYTFGRWEKINLVSRQAKNDNINPADDYLQFVGAAAEQFHFDLENNIKESLNIIEDIRKFLYGKVGESQPHFVHFKEVLEDILSLNSIALNEIIQIKSTRDEIITIDNEEVRAHETQETKIKEASNEVSALKIQSIDHAYKLLTLVSDYLLKNEPNYPAGYIVKNALSYRYLVLKEFLKEQVKNSNDLQKVFEILKIK